MLKTFVRFYLPNDEQIEVEIDDRSLTPDDIPNKAFAYEFYDAQVVKAQDDELCYGSPRNRSPLIWISCPVLSIKELREIIKNMEEHNVDDVIFTPYGESFFYNEDESYVFVSYDELKNQQ